MKTRTASVIAWGSTALYAVLISTGLTLQAVSRVPEDPVGGMPWLAVTSVAFLASSVIGSLIAFRRPSNPIGWIVCGLALVWAIEHFAFGYAAYALVAHPGSLPAGMPMALLSTTIFFVAEFGIVLLFLLFPSGRLPSPRWRVVVWTALGALTVLLSLTPFDPDAVENLGLENPWGARGVFAAVGLPVFLIAFLAQFAILIASAVSLIVRVRAAHGEERQQLKWLVYAASFLPIGFGFVFFGSGTTPHAIGIVFLAFALIGFPVACAVAIFRYRLYDIDPVINRTVVFGALAAFITAVYVVVVVGLGQLLGTRGEPNVGLSILATVVVAVAFQPVRERVQRFANKLVYGRKATPYEVLSAFVSRMGGTYDSEELLPRMARILAEGTGAARAEVWLTVEDVMRRATAWPEAPPSERLRVEGGEIPAFPGSTKAAPVAHQGELLGALTITKPQGEPLTPAEDKLLLDLASQAGLVLRNVRLIEDLKASRQRLATAQDAERRRLERNIHDGAQQRLVALAVKFQLLERIAVGDADKEALARLHSETTDTLSELRDLARGIYPPLLAERGLVAALEAQAHRAAVPVEIEADGIERYPQEAEAAAYFCCLEALQNAAKYANAGWVVVRLSHADGSLAFIVEDGGVGFDPASTPRGSGLQNMADRVEALGGLLEVRSAPGEGTVVSGHVPARAMEGVG
ncbi:MAG: histidine kinase [Actinomycetota bacterium]